MTKKIPKRNCPPPAPYRHERKGGFASIPRSIRFPNHPILRGREKWINALIWMAMKAVYRPTTTINNGIAYDLHRGETLISVPLLSRLFFGSHAGTQKFIETLLAEGLITTRRGKQRNAMTIAQLADFEAFCGEGYSADEIIGKQDLPPENQPSASVGTPNGKLDGSSIKSSKNPKILCPKPADADSDDDSMVFEGQVIRLTDSQYRDLHAKYVPIEDAQEYRQTLERLDEYFEREPSETGKFFDRLKACLLRIGNGDWSIEEGGYWEFHCEFSKGE